MHLLLLHLDWAALADVNTIKELSNILALHKTRVVDVRSSLGNVVQIVSFQDNLILDIFSADDSDTGAHVDTTDKEFSQKVANLNQRSLADGLLGLGVGGGEVNLDGEMRIGEAHLVSVSLGNADHHVLDGGGDGVDTGFGRSGGKPKLEKNLAALGDSAQVTVDVLEGFGKTSQRSSHPNFSCRDVHVDIGKNINDLLDLDIPYHGCA
eukprot:246667_1